jgi:hypothetical protein
MKTKEFVALEKRLLPSITGFSIKGSILFVAPIEHTLRGFSFEGSDFDKTSFYVWRFFLPMCVPNKYLSFSFGDRIRDNNTERWNAEEANLHAKLAAAIQKETAALMALKTPQDVVRVLVTLARNSVDPYRHEALAYMLARAGETDAAVSSLDHLLTLLNSAVPWQQEMGSRAQMLKTKLFANPHEAAQQLVAWEVESIHNLGLDEFRAASAPAATPKPAN